LPAILMGTLSIYVAEVLSRSLDMMSRFLFFPVPEDLISYLIANRYWISFSYFSVVFATLADTMPVRFFSPPFSAVWRHHTPFAIRVFAFPIQSGLGSQLFKRVIRTLNCRGETVLYHLMEERDAFKVQPFFVESLTND